MCRGNRSEQKRRDRGSGRENESGRMAQTKPRNLAAAIGALLLMLAAFSQPAYAVRYASMIVDETSGAILHAVNPDSRVYPASLTKMMTLYQVFEALATRRLLLDQKLPVSQRASRRPKSRLGLKYGQAISVRDAVGALVTKSANDVATVVAEALGGSEENFAALMTHTARRLGMTRTTFRNASGLPDEDQITTARDMVRLVIALRRDFPQFNHYFSMQDFTYRGRTFNNHNRLLKRYKGTTGMKTGYVQASGFNIAVSVERDGERLIGLVFGGKSAGKRDSHMITLFRRVFSTIAENKRFQPKLPVVSNTGDQNRVAAITQAPRSESRNDDSNDWSVQVGAFERFAPAHLAATRAARLAPSLNRARIEIKSTPSSGGRIYRARLSGLTEDRAGEACRTLKRRKVRCLVVKTENDTAEGDN